VVGSRAMRSSKGSSHPGIQHTYTLHNTADARMFFFFFVLLVNDVTAAYEYSAETSQVYCH